MLDVVAEQNITVKTNPFFGLKEIPKLVALARGGKMAGKAISIIDEKEMQREKQRLEKSS